MQKTSRQPSVKARRRTPGPAPEQGTAHSRWRPGLSESCVSGLKPRAPGPPLSHPDSTNRRSQCEDCWCLHGLTVSHGFTPFGDASVGCDPHKREDAQTSEQPDEAVRLTKGRTLDEDDRKQS
jgi:hypothetical protein